MQMMKSFFLNISNQLLRVKILSEDSNAYMFCSVKSICANLLHNGLYSPKCHPHICLSRKNVEIWRTFENTSAKELERWRQGEKFGASPSFPLRKVVFAIRISASCNSRNKINFSLFLQQKVENDVN